MARASPLGRVAARPAFAFWLWLMTCGTIAWMKEVIAVVRPFLAEKVLEALKLAPIEACTVREVKGFGRQKSYLDQYGDSEYSLAFLPKVEIQLWVEDGRVDEVVDRIAAAARTGRMGDGKIFVMPAAERVFSVNSVASPAADRRQA